MFCSLNDIEMLEKKNKRTKVKGYLNMIYLGGQKIKPDKLRHLSTKNLSFFPTFTVQFDCANNQPFKKKITTCEFNLFVNLSLVQLILNDLKLCTISSLSFNNKSDFQKKF